MIISRLITCGESKAFAAELSIREHQPNRYRLLNSLRCGLQTIEQGSKTLRCVSFTKLNIHLLLERVFLNFSGYSLTVTQIADLREDVLLTCLVSSIHRYSGSTHHKRIIQTDMYQRVQSNNWKLYTAFGSEQEYLEQKLLNLFVKDGADLLTEQLKTDLVMGSEEKLTLFWA
ncbi:hypothetical protein CSKR_112688 [Clonorchis sinensis]|uniref:Uncharacterized protein n=1 Tax=Clonorchis sinensis TaxID=79923 RepID=A0A419Q189_CLOSI|nr:hypothetical protein CSKR_112688 [Clonorchis sinensis]